MSVSKVSEKSLRNWPGFQRLSSLQRPEILEYPERFWNQAREVLNAYNYVVSYASYSRHPKYQFAAALVSPGNFFPIGNNGINVGRHAEITVLSRDRNFANKILLVTRVNRATPQVVRCSKPCRVCFNLARDSGIQWIAFISNRKDKKTLKIVWVPEEYETSYKERTDKDRW
jgi:hypothetical protein